MAEEARTQMPVQPGDIIGGKYRVDRVLGTGGMGVVVAATHTDLDQQVALKFILPEALAGKDAVERFMREARSVAKLKSEHVARVYDVGRDAHRNPFMVLELLEGVDLAKLSRQRGPLAVADSVEFVLQACEALVEAHAAGIIHRDLKPQNLFIGRRLNGMPLVKVLDFGIAKPVGAAAVGQMALTDSQAIMGSPLYMAPEHMRSARSADTRSDIWSLGVILFELLGGQVPFDGETVTEVCIRVVNESPPSLLSLRPGLDPNLTAIVMRCLEKDPSARWQTVAELATALEPYARSAQHGGAHRPWRSFEETMDSTPRSMPRPTADETGPATAIIMTSGDDLSRISGDLSSNPSRSTGSQGSPSFGYSGASVAQLAGPARDAYGSASFGATPSGFRNPTGPLGSTNATWGSPSDSRGPAKGLRRVATAAVALLAIVAIVGVGGGSTLLRRSSSVPATTSGAPPQESHASSSTSTATSEPPPLSVNALPDSTVSIPVTMTTTPAARPSRVLITPGRSRPSPSATVPTPPPVGTETAPNGAPILR